MNSVDLGRLRILSYSAMQNKLLVGFVASVLIHVQDEPSDAFTGFVYDLHHEGDAEDPRPTTSSRNSVAENFYPPNL